MDGFRLLPMVLIALCCLPLASAQEERSGAPLEASDRGQRVLVLVDGQLMENSFIPRPDGYDVQVPGGRLFVESARVRFVAKSREDAYRQMRQSWQSLTPETHMTLARWCLSNRLPLQARREVLDALQLDPNRQDAKKLLQTILYDQEASTGGPPATGVTQYPSLKLSALPLPEARSLAGLTRPLAQSFVRHVQPLLSNKCATAGCHGLKAESEFRLSSIRSGSQPLTAERNLAAILKQIDLTQPARSPILTMTATTHGGMLEPAFRGRVGNQQQQMLRQWVRSVAMEIAPELNEEAADDQKSDVQLVSGESEIRPQSGLFDNTEDDLSEITSGPREAAHGVQRKTEESDQQFLKEAHRASARDAFDPAAFNRMFHASGAVEADTNGDSEPSEQQEPDLDQ